MIPYHGGPITPETAAIYAWEGGHALVSFAATQQVELAMSITQSAVLDNGAFSDWKRTGRPRESWADYYRWSEKWLAYPACDWAVIPDVIEGSEEENDALLDEWPHGLRGVPVWHLNESVERLARLAADWPRIALGSSAEFDSSKPKKCLDRLARTLPAICDADGRPTVKLHGLRMMRPELVTNVPFASADSSNVARNCGMDTRWKGSYPPRTREGRALVLRQRMESYQAPDRMDFASHLLPD